MPLIVSPSPTDERAGSGAHRDARQEPRPAQGPAADGHFGRRAEPSRLKRGGQPRADGHGDRRPAHARQARRSPRDGDPGSSTAQRQGGRQRPHERSSRHAGHGAADGGGDAGRGGARVGRERKPEGQSPHRDVPWTVPSPFTGRHG